MSFALILIPFLLLIALNMPFKFPKARVASWVAGAVFVVQSLLALAYPAFQPSLDALSLLCLVAIGIVAFVSLLVAQGTIAKDQQRFHFINLLLVSLIGMNATVLVRDIFSLYVFIELTAVSVFVLMAIEKNEFAIEATFKYLVLSIIASVFILSSIALFILAAGDLSFTALHAAFLNTPDNILLKFATGLLLCGLLIKSAAVPFHGWAPDVYSDSQAAASVLLAGIVTKASGVYALLRLFGTVFILSAPIQNILMFVGLASIILAALAAFTQDDLKRMLSYSSISQVGYILLALGCGTPLAFAGAAFHFFNHAIFKSLLFTNAASLEKKFGSTDMIIIAGLGYHLPVTRVTSLLGALSCAGLPPLAGFWSKLIIITALLNSGRFFYGSAALIASVLTLAYFLVLERNIFFVKIETPLEDKRGAPLGIKFSEILLTAITVGVGLGFPFVFNTWILPIKEMLR